VNGKLDVDAANIVGSQSGGPEPPKPAGGVTLIPIIVSLAELGRRGHEAGTPVASSLGERG
jgi:hypothetical protein